MNGWLVCPRRITSERWHLIKYIFFIVFVIGRTRYVVNKKQLETGNSYIVVDKTGYLEVHLFLHLVYFGYESSSVYVDGHLHAMPLVSV